MEFLKQVFAEFYGSLFLLTESAFVYLRVSTDRQTVENQRLQIEKFAKSRDLEVPTDYWFSDEATSGTVSPKEREGFRDLTETIQAMKESKEPLPKCVLVYEISRLGRNFWEILDVVRALEDVCPVITTSPKESFLQIEDRGLRNLFLSFLAWVAERERENLIQRVHEGTARAKIENRHSGELPLGYGQHVCEKLLHSRCALSGKLYLDERGKKVWSMLQLNQETTPKQVMQEMGISKYKQAWNLLQSVKKFGYLPSSLATIPSPQPP